MNYQTTEVQSSEQLNTCPHRGSLSRPLYVLAGAAAGISAGLERAIMDEGGKTLHGGVQWLAPSEGTARRAVSGSTHRLKRLTHRAVRQSYVTAGAAIGVSLGLHRALWHLYLDLVEDDVTRSLLLGSPIRYKVSDLRRLQRHDPSPPLTPLRSERWHARGQSF